MSAQQTIYALSSGTLPSGVAIIRISGPDVRFVLETMCGFIPKPRFAQLTPFYTQDGLVIDRGLLLFFEAPASFTGEDCAEFHLHGGRAVVQACFKALACFDNLRLAEAGEFSKRAFDNGKMDLTAAEGLADLIVAETEAQRRLALAQSSGSLKELYQKWSEDILRYRALIEAELDFSDEEDIPGSVSDQVWGDVERLIADMQTHLDRSQIGEIARNGYVIVIAGAPNAGKSTLLNALAGRDVAIVSNEAGTTRDIVEVRLDIDGQLVIIKDTAGIRETGSAIEQEGIKRARNALRTADLVLLLKSEEDVSAIDIHLDGLKEDKILEVKSKSDLLADVSTKERTLAISAKTGYNIDKLIKMIAERLSEFSHTDDAVIPTRQRHIDLLKYGLDQLRLALGAEYLEIELRAEHLRQCQEALGKITGQVDVEDLLGVIFNEFCVGK